MRFPNPTTISATQAPGAEDFLFSQQREPHTLRARETLRRHAEIRSLAGTECVECPSPGLSRGAADFLRRAVVTGAGLGRSRLGVCGRRFPGSHPLGAHPRVLSQPRVPTRVLEPDRRDRSESPAHPAERDLVSDIPSEAPRVSGRVRAGRGHPEPLGSAARRTLHAQEGALAPLLPDLPGRAPAAAPRDPATWGPGWYANIGVQLAYDAAVWTVLRAEGSPLFRGLVPLSVGLHPLGARWIQEHYLVFEGQETSSYYGPLNVVALNVGHHNEHHDFPSVPWNRLPAIRRSAPEVLRALPPSLVDPPAPALHLRPQALALLPGGPLRARAESRPGGRPGRS